MDEHVKGNGINRIISVGHVALCNNKTLQDFLPMPFLIISELPRGAHIPTGKSAISLFEAK